MRTSRFSNHVRFAMRTLTLGLCALLVGSMIVGCGSASTEEDSASNDDALLLADFEQGDRIHAMPLRPQASLAPDVTPPAGAHLTYFGGPVLSSVKVYAVYWG